MVLAPLAAGPVLGKVHAMKTMRRLIYTEVLTAVGFVTLAFLGLFFFFDLVEDLQNVAGRHSPNYQLNHALLYVALLIPIHVYELMPITVLIGCIFVMARMAQSSEFTILRTSGMGPGLALRHLMLLGLLFALLTFVMGDHIAPWCEREGRLLKSRFEGGVLHIGQNGAWLKEKQKHSQFAVNVGAINGEGQMRDIRLYEFSPSGRLISHTLAQKGRIANTGGWVLIDVARSEFGPSQETPKPVAQSQLPDMLWPSDISQDMVTVALIKPERMGIWDLFHYVRHLENNAQTAQRYEIEFWKKVFYPLSCLVMVVLALPFAYLHMRNVNIATYVFIGVMFGVSFFLLNNMFGHIGNLNQWTPWLAAALPGMIYSLMSLGAFAWLVLRQ
jgi:lipopolysaccharide export system permease protein